MPYILPVSVCFITGGSVLGNKREGFTYTV